MVDVLDKHLARFLLYVLYASGAFAEIRVFVFHGAASAAGCIR